MATPKQVQAISPTPIPLGGFFADFATAVSDYAETYVALSIVSVAPENPPTGTAVNVNDIWKFKVRLNNNGNLNLTDVIFHINGKSGAQISSAAAGPWLGGITTTLGRDVNAHDYADGVYFYFKAPATQFPSSVQLVEAHISSFNSNLNYMLNDLTGHEFTPSGIYSAQVEPL